MIICIAVFYSFLRGRAKDVTTQFISRHEFTAAGTCVFVGCKRCFSCRCLFWARSKDARERFNSVRAGRGVTQAVFFGYCCCCRERAARMGFRVFARHHNQRKECTGQSRLCILFRFVLIGLSQVCHGAMGAVKRYIGE